MLKLGYFLISAAVLLAPAAAHAAVWSLCMKYGVEVSDTNIGEDYDLVPTGLGAWPARGAKVRVFNGGVWGPFVNTSTTTGCFNVTAPPMTTVLIELHAEHTLANGQKVYVRNDYQSTQALKVWTFVGVLSAPNPINFTTPYGPESNLAAIVPTVVQRVSGLTGNLTSAANKFVNVYPQNCAIFDPDDCYGSAYVKSVNSIFIAYELDHDVRKFLVGHETGHFLERYWGGDVGVGGLSYMPDDLEPNCAFMGLGDHGMRSREQDTAAYKEGVAHFISAAAWNNVAQTDGKFKYYKNQSPYSEEVIDLNAPGLYDFNWEGSQCAPKEPGRSVEGDWMRFFWNYVTDAADPQKPTMNDLALHIFQLYLQPPGLTSSNAYARLLATLTNAGQLAYLTRFTNRATTHGVVDP